MCGLTSLLTAVLLHAAPTWVASDQGGGGAGGG